MSGISVIEGYVVVQHHADGKQQYTKVTHLECAVRVLAVLQQRKSFDFEIQGTGAVKFRLGDKRCSTDMIFLWVFNQYLESEHVVIR